MNIDTGFSLPSGPEIKDFIIKWTPRAIAVGIGGYYGLGLAYDLGLMASIDQVAICVLKHYVGYAGIGALMPTIQWYGAWAVRLTCCLGAGIVYDLTEKVSKACFCYLEERWNNYKMA